MQPEQDSAGTGSRAWTLLVWAWPPFLGGVRPTYKEASAVFWAPRPLPCWDHHLRPVWPQAQLGRWGVGQVIGHPRPVLTHEAKR